MQRLVLPLVLLGCAASVAPRGPRVDLVLPALDGGEVDLTRYRGRVVVLHVFETGSAAAVGDVSQLEAASEDRRLIVVGIAIDRAGRPVVAPFRKALALSYLVALGSPDALADSALGAIRVVPTTLLLDREGRVVRRIEHPLAAGELNAALEALLTSRE